MRRAALIAVAVIVALAAASCGGAASRTPGASAARSPGATAPPAPAARPSGPTVDPDEVRDVVVGSTSANRTIEPGKRTIRFRVRCDGPCAKLQFDVRLVFPGYRRPPIALALREGSEIVRTRASDQRCWEDDFVRAAPPTTCTALVAHGWVRRSLGEPRPAIRVVDLVIDNRGPARAARMLVTVIDDPPR